MDKIKISKEQAKSIEVLRNGRFSFVDFMEHYVNQNFGVRNMNLLELEAEDLARALLDGYEIEKPKRPQYINDKIDVSFNTCEEDMVLNNGENAIYMGIIAKTYVYSHSFSIQEATDIKNTLGELIDYYYQYVSPNDNNE